MFEQINFILAKVSFLHLNILVLLGLALFGGTIGGRIFQKLRIPQVVGYIAIGIIIGESGFKIVDHKTILALQPFNYFALGLIGFMIGGELKKEVLLKYGRQFMIILLFEGFTSFLLVGGLVAVIGTFLFKDWHFAVSLGLLLGAISSATAPAATTDVLWEYKSRGPLTRTVLGIVALDDALALLLFAFASSIAVRLTQDSNGSFLNSLIHPVYEIGGSLLIGVLAGRFLSKILRTITEKDKMLTFLIGTVLFLLGLSLVIKVDMLLAAMTLGAVIANYTPRKSKEVFKLVEGFTPPIYVLFFVLVGAKLNVSSMTLPVIVLVLVYLVGRTLGKGIGANAGARIANAAKTVQKYLPLCLFSQAGVAIGLSIVAAHIFPDEIGNIIVIVITTSTFVVQLIGPSCTKLAITKAKEVGLNITEEDLISKTKVKDVLDKENHLIYENMKLIDILTIFSQSNNLYYPVVDNEKKLTGVITVDHIKNTFMETSLGHLLLANDFMEKAIAKTGPETSMAEVKEILDKYNLEYLPVVTENNEVLGILERRVVNKLISTKIIELQKQAEVLDS
ncbi:MAG: cation:proton antiporter [Candidatus Omnitrophota bacterium]